MDIVTISSAQPTHLSQTLNWLLMLHSSLLLLWIYNEPVYVYHNCSSNYCSSTCVCSCRSRCELCRELHSYTSSTADTKLKVNLHNVNSVMRSSLGHSLWPLSTGCGGWHVNCLQCFVPISFLHSSIMSSGWYLQGVAITSGGYVAVIVSNISG